MLNSNENTTIFIDEKIENAVCDMGSHFVSALMCWKVSTTPFSPKPTQTASTQWCHFPWVRSKGHQLDIVCWSLQVPQNNIDTQEETLPE